MSDEREQLRQDIDCAVQGHLSRESEDALVAVALAYAELRVAEAVVEVERICGEWGCNPKFTLLLTSALSPAREASE